MSRSKFKAYYGYRNRPISLSIAADNGLHKSLYKKAHKQGIFISFANAQDTYRSVNVSEIKAGKYDMATEISFASMKELNGQGLPLAPAAYIHQKATLIPSYLLNSCLCFVEEEGVNGEKTTYFATKNIKVVEALHEFLHPTENLAKLIDYKTELKNTVEEINFGNFSVVCIKPVMGGLKIEKGKFKCNKVNISPMYSVGLWNDSIIRFLKKNIVNIMYVEGKEIKFLTTSLIRRSVAEWLGSNKRKAVKKVISETQDAFCLSNIILPDLNDKNKLVTVPIMGIRNISSV